MRTRFRDLHEAAVQAPDIGQTTEILAVADGLVARLAEFRGHMLDGGGQMDYTFGDVAAYENGLLVHQEYHDPDPVVVLARFHELAPSARPHRGARAGGRTCMPSTPVDGIGCARSTPTT